MLTKSLRAPCPKCKKIQAIQLRVIQTCDCEKKFVCIDSYCKDETQNTCTSSCFGRQEFITGEKIAKDSNYAFFKIKTRIECELNKDCKNQWPAEIIAHNQENHEKKPFNGFLIIPVESFENRRIYHGTKFDRIPSILRKGLLPPRNINDKNNGFLVPEGDLIFFGLNKSAAQHHAEEVCVLEFSYSGYVASSNINVNAPGLRLLFEKLPEEIKAIKFLEDSGSLACRPDANFKLLDHQHNTDLMKTSLIVSNRKQLSSESNGSFANIKLLSIFKSTSHDV